MSLTSISSALHVRAALVLLAGLLVGCFSVADARDRRGRRSSGAFATFDAGPPDTGTCPGVDCELTTNQYAALFDGVDDRFNSLSTNWPIFNPSSMTCCYLGTNAAWSTATTETVFEKYDAVPKTGFGHSLGGANQNSVYAPNASGTPTELMRADAGVPTTPVGTCVSYDMLQANNAAMMLLWRTGGGSVDGGPTMGSVGNKVSVGATSGPEIRSTTSPLSIGARYVADGGASAFASMKIAEFICFDNALDSAQINALFPFDGGVSMADPRGHENWDQCLVWYSFGENGVDEFADGGIVVRDRCGANDLVAIGTNDGGPTRVAWP